LTQKEAFCDDMSEEAGQLTPLPTRSTFLSTRPTIIGQLAPLSFGQLAPP